MNEDPLSNPEQENPLLQRNYSESSSTLGMVPSMTSGTSHTYSDPKDSLSMSSLHSSESLGSVAASLQTLAFTDLLNFDSRSSGVNEPLSSITDLDETIKSPLSVSKERPNSSSQPRQLHVAHEVIERYDEGVFDDGATSQNEDEETSNVMLVDSDDEDEIEHFDSTDSITVTLDNAEQRASKFLSPKETVQTCLDSSNNLSIGNQSVNYGKPVSPPTFPQGNKNHSSLSIHWHSDSERSVSSW